MKQALHIFRKDLRHLRLEAVLVAVLAALLAVLEGTQGGAWWAEMLFGFAAAHLIARLVHAETIPGTRQFWLTRPYRPWSLLTAKVLFATAFISVPLCLAQLFIVLQANFPVRSIVPGLFWSQAVVLTTIILPVMAVAALTPGIVPFIFTTLVALAIGFSTQQKIWLLVRRPPVDLLWPASVEWIRESAMGIALAVTATSVLYVQYRYRWTKVGRALGVTGVAAGALAWLYMPRDFALATQLRLSDRDVHSEAVTVAMDSESRLSRGTVSGRGDDRVRLIIPIVIHSAAMAVPDAFELRIQDSDGRSWSTLSEGVNPTRRARGKLEATALLPASFVTAAGDRKLTARVTVWLTLFEQSATKPVRLQAGPVNVMDGLQCYPGPFNYLWCQSPFRWPKQLVYAKVSDNDIRPLTSLISYSPFPGGPGFNPIEARWAPGPIRPEEEITIIAQRPVAHLRRDFDVGTFRFPDLPEAR